MRCVNSVLTMLVAVGATVGWQDRDLCGLGSIPFGAHRAEVISMLASACDLRQDRRMAESLYSGTDGTQLWLIHDGLYLTKYRMGRRKYSVGLQFNSKDQFCAYILSGRPCLEFEVNSALRRELRYLWRRLGGGEVRQTARWDCVRDDVVHLNCTRFLIKDTGNRAAVAGTLREISAQSGEARYRAAAAVCDKQLRAQGAPLALKAPVKNPKELTSNCRKVTIKAD